MKVVARKTWGHKNLGTQYELLLLRAGLLSYWHGTNSTSDHSRHASPHHAAREPATAGFFNDGGYAASLDLMAEWCREEGVEVWAWACMPNHTHLIAVPSSEEGPAPCDRRSASTLGQLKRDNSAAITAFARLAVDQEIEPATAIVPQADPFRRCQLAGELW